MAAETDVLVVGGGPAGVGAALAAARLGAKTLVVEQFNCLGGVATAGGHGHISKYDEDGTGRRIVGGIAHEIGDALVQRGFGTRNSHGVWFEVEGLKLLLEEMAGAAGVALLYHTFFCDTVIDGGAVTGAVIQNKGGRQVIRAKRVIDCTGDGDVAFHAGCAFEMGRKSDHRCQPVTLMFTIGGVDWPQVERGRTSYAMTDVWEEAQRQGDMRPFQKTVMGFWWTPTRPDQIGVNFTHIIHVDATRAEELTRATLEGRRQAYESIAVFRKYVRGMDATIWRPPRGFKYHIPYRILLPRGVENLLTAGRCVSCTHVALGSLRVMVPCIGMGQAAGTAAALSLTQGTTPRHLAVGDLQATLRQHGAILDEADIRRAQAEANARAG